MLTLRSARPDDVDTILQLVRALADYERLAHEVAAVEKIKPEAATAKLEKLLNAA